MNENRRAKLRYDLQLELVYRTLKRSRNVAGSGTTLNLSSKAILFQPGDGLSEGDLIEATIHWPMLLDNTLHLNLAISGIVVRCDGRGCVVKMLSHEFRTRASRTASASTGSDCAFLPMVEGEVLHVDQAGRGR